MQPDIMLQETCCTLTNSFLCDRRTELLKTTLEICSIIFNSNVKKLIQTSWIVPNFHKLSRTCYRSTINHFLFIFPLSFYEAYITAIQEIWASFVHWISNFYLHPVDLSLNLSIYIETCQLYPLPPWFSSISDSKDIKGEMTHAMDINFSYLLMVLWLFGIFFMPLPKLIYVIQQHDLYRLYY